MNKAYTFIKVQPWYNLGTTLVQPWYNLGMTLTSQQSRFNAILNLEPSDWQPRVGVE
ncbi:hypothetical protein [Pseudoalteromonas sp. PS5]|uniref:hypothetical protein n=1 Tax=Pseudoalteromonas sp. PS5 TaxID=1437473 RepID=UPI0013875FAE|nr:hypothetical protein [Pseudoalteromonas sp. PS5]